MAGRSNQLIKVQGKQFSIFQNRWWINFTAWWETPLRHKVQQFLRNDGSLAMDDLPANRPAAVFATNHMSIRSKLKFWLAHVGPVKCSCHGRRGNDKPWTLQRSPLQDFVLTWAMKNPAIPVQWQVEAFPWWVLITQYVPSSKAPGILDGSKFSRVAKPGTTSDASWRIVEIEAPRVVRTYVGMSKSTPQPSQSGYYLPGKAHGGKKPFRTSGPSKSLFYAGNCFLNSNHDSSTWNHWTGSSRHGFYGGLPGFKH